MSEVVTANQSVEPNDIIVANLASLILSEELHDNKGAVIAAQYIADQAEITPNTYNLCAYAGKVVWYGEVTDFLSQESSKKTETVNQTITSAGRVKDALLRPIERVLLPLMPSMRRIRQSEALLELAKYKVENGYTTNTETAEEDFRSVLETAPAIERYLTKRVSIPDFYRSLLYKPVPSSQELMVVDTLRPMTRPHHSPLQLLRYREEGRRLKRAKRDRQDLQDLFNTFQAE